MTSALDLIRDAGVVGAGGAGFPAHVKFGSQAEILVINAAECEPLLKTDQYVMARFPDRLVTAALAIQGIVGAKKTVFGLKKHYHRQIEALKGAAVAVKGGENIEFALLDSVYPAGDEQVLLYETTGRTVPPGGIPIAAGAVVANAGTLLNVANALEGKPVTWKYLTVAGCVNTPSVVLAPIGTSFNDCIALAGGASAEAASAPHVIAGGPIMGRPVADPAAEVVTKTTSGVIVLPGDHYLKQRQRLSPDHIKNRARASCIQCALCSELCPRRLLGSPLRPHLVMRAFGAAADTDALLDNGAARNAALCCECGICEIYSCPMELSPCRVNIMIKGELRRRGIKPVFPAAAGPSPDRPYRRLPTERMAARAGVLKYFAEKGGGDPEAHFVEMTKFQKLSIPLQMHAGVPAEPCVAAGQKVEAGALIAAVPEGKLGARIHAPAAGTVAEIAGGRIVIEQGGKA